MTAFIQTSLGLINADYVASVSPLPNGEPGALLFSPHVPGGGLKLAMPCSQFIALLQRGGVKVVTVEPLATANGPDDDVVSATVDESGLTSTEGAELLPMGVIGTVN